LAAAAFSSSARVAFKLLDRSGGGATSTTGGDQEVAGVAVLDLDDFAQVTEVDHFVEQNDLHGVLP
jgi:hypothetical protein